MSKSRQKTHSETEHLRGQIKNLKSENRQLRKRLKELEKQSHFYEEIADEAIEEVKVKNTCKACGEGVLQEVDLGIKVLVKCDSCDYKRTRKSHVKKEKE